MKNSPLTFLVVFGFMFASSVSHAAEGWYFGGGNDGMYLDYSELAGSAGVVAALATEARYDSGVNAGRFVGYDFGNNLRIEGEVGFRRSGLEEVAAFGDGLAAERDRNTVNLMANLLYDFDIEGVLKPYLSAGLGLAFVSLDRARNLAGVPADGAVVAYQVGAGVGLALSSSVGVSLDYRFLAINDPKFSADGAPFEAEDFRHSLGIHLRFRF